MTASTPGGSGSGNGFPQRLHQWIQYNGQRMEQLRQRAEQNPSDLNTMGFPDWATDSSIREKKIQRSILTAFEKRTGRDLSQWKQD